MAVDPAWVGDATWLAHQAAVRSRAHLLVDAPLRILELCAGSSSPSVALSLLMDKSLFELAGFYDVNDDVREVAIAAHDCKDRRDVIRRVHIGPMSGNISKQNDSLFEDADCIVAGPPCPPFSSQSMARNIWADRRAAVFVKVIKVIGNLASRPRAPGRRPLSFFILENVVGLLFRPSSGDNGTPSANAPIDHVMELLHQYVPCEWTFTWDVLNSQDYGLPQHRRRVYIVGRRAEAAAGPPAPPRFARQMTIGEILIPSLPAEAPYSALQLRNIAGFKDFYLKEMEDAGFHGKHVLFDRTRCPGDGWVSDARKYDLCPCLIASGPLLHVFSLGDGRRSAGVDRPVTAVEHGRLQGFPDRVIDGSAGLTQRTAKAIWGNAMSVPVIGSVLARELVLFLDCEIATPSGAAARPQFAPHVEAGHGRARASGWEEERTPASPRRTLECGGDALVAHSIDPPAQGPPEAPQCYMPETACKMLSHQTMPPSCL
jgi:site-specific DNA-cytosine methylase